MTAVTDSVESRPKNGALEKYRFWAVGALTGTDSVDTLWQIAPFLIAGYVVAFAAAPGLNTLALGDDMARAFTDQAGYDALAAIAPTIPALGEGQVDTWQDLTTVAGEFMRDEAGAQAIIDDYDTMVADLAAEFPGLAGKTYASANYVPGDMIYVLADPEDGSSQFFGDLGLEIAPAILDAADGVSGRAQFSLEQIGLLDADLLLILTNGADTDDIVGFDQLGAVQSGAWASMDYSMAVALNTPNALSLTWVVDQIRPALEAAAG